MTSYFELDGKNIGDAKGRIMSVTHHGGRISPGTESDAYGYLVCMNYRCHVRIKYAC